MEQSSQTTLIQLDPLHPEGVYIEQAARLIQQGKLVVFPTETVYGLGADALQPRAVEQIFTAKGRPFSDPLIVHIADMAMLSTLVLHVSATAQRLAEAFWPGPLTLIFPASPRVPGLITAGLPTVAIRMPRHPIALALIRAAGTPIAAPSANRFMHISPTTAQHALADLQGRVPLILDGGSCEVGVESTILDLSSDPPAILRPGGIGLEQLQRILPTVRPPQPRVQSSEAIETTPQMAPGQMLIHYSPSVPTFLFEGSTESMRNAMLAHIARYQANNQRVGVLIADDDSTAFQHSGADIYLLGHTLEQVATHLFAGLRTLEEAGVQVILCRSFDDHGLGLAIRDRLRKAAGGKIFTV